jgi:hypothetical protein
MADKVTGYGCTLDELEMSQGQLKSLTELRESMEAAVGGAKSIETLFDMLKIENSRLMVDGEQICKLDDEGWSKFAKVLKIPTAYLLRLDAELKSANVTYWFEQMPDKEVTLIYKDNMLLDVSAGKEVSKLDIVRSLDSTLDDWDVFQITNQTNSMTIDIVDSVNVYDTERDTYFGGLRVVLPHTFLAPDVSPIFLNVNSCAILECDDGIEKMNISGLMASEIVDEMAVRVQADVDSLPQRFRKFEDNAAGKVENPRHRISLYCREHHLPDRVRAYALSAFDDSGLSDVTFEDVIDLFSSLSYADGVKGASARKLQILAGYVMANAKAETRCHTCESLIVPD